MAEEVGKRKRRHHIVPRFYLERFADGNGQLLRVPLPGAVRQLVGIGDATVRKDFYTLELQDGTLSDDFEDWLGSVERRAADGLRRILDEGEWPPRPNDRLAIGRWIGVQHLRTPAVRKSHNEIADSLLKMQAALSGPAGVRKYLQAQSDGPVEEAEVDEWWKFIKDVDGYSLEQHPNTHLQTIGELADPTAEMFANRQWVLIEFQRKRLATCDTPVVLHAGPEYPRFYGVGLATATEIQITVSRNAALILGEPGGSDARVDGTAKIAQMINQSVAMNAREAVFHHPEDRPLTNIKLEPPREHESNASSMTPRIRDWAAAADGIEGT